MIWENAFLVCETHIYILGETERHSLNYAGGKKERKKQKRLAGDTQNVICFRVELYFYFSSIFDIQPNLKQLAYITLL